MRFVLVVALWLGYYGLGDRVQQIPGHFFAFLAISSAIVAAGLDLEAIHK